MSDTETQQSQQDNDITSKVPAQDSGIANADVMVDTTTVVETPTSAKPEENPGHFVVVWSPSNYMCTVMSHITKWLKNDDTSLLEDYLTEAAVVNAIKREEAKVVVLNEGASLIVGSILTRTSKAAAEAQVLPQVGIDLINVLNRSSRSGQHIVLMFDSDDYNFNQNTAAQRSSMAIVIGRAPVSNYATLLSLAADRTSHYDMEHVHTEDTEKCVQCKVGDGISIDHGTDIASGTFASYSVAMGRVTYLMQILQSQKVTNIKKWSLMQTGPTITYGSIGGGDGDDAEGTDGNSGDIQVFIGQ